MFLNRRCHNSCWILILIFFLLILLPHPSFPKGRKKDSQKNELRFWHSIGTYNKDILNTLIETFNEKNDQITVHGVFQGNEEDLYVNLTSQENLPNIVQVPIQFLGSLKRKNLIIDMSSLIPHRLQEDIAEKFWQSVSIDDGIYGVPFSYSVPVLFVNQHILRSSGAKQYKEPRTWQDIVSIAQKIKYNSNGKWAVFFPMESVLQLIAFVESYSGTPVLRDQTLVINSAEAISAMEFLQKLVYEQKFMPPKITVAEGNQLFLSGNLGLILASSTMLVYTASNLPYNLNIWPLPSPKGIRPTVSGSCLSVIRSENRQEKEAFRFIEYLLDAENAIKWHTHTGTPAIRTSIQQSLDLLVFYEENPNYMTSIIELDRGKIVNPDIDYFTLNKIIKKALEEIMIEGGNVEKILNTAQKEIGRLR